MHILCIPRVIDFRKNLNENGHLECVFRSSPSTPTMRNMSPTIGLRINYIIRSIEKNEKQT